MTRDPRPSILERYASADTHSGEIRRAAQRLVQNGLIIGEDIDRVVESDWGRPGMDVK